MMGTQHRQEWVEPDELGEQRSWSHPQRRLQHQVEIQSHRIEQVLSRHQVPADVSGGSVRPHWVSFDLATQLSGSWDRLRKLTGELTSALGVPEVRLDRREGRLRLAVKRYEPHPVDLLDLLELLPEVRDLSLALGLDHQGCPVMLNLAQDDLHNVLVTGIPGAGKSSLMRTVAIAVAMTCRQSVAQLSVVSIGSEPSGITSRPDPLAPVNYLPHMLFPLADTLEDAVEALAYLVDEAAYRAEAGIRTPSLIVLIDDADMLLRRAGSIAGEQLGALLHAPAESGLRVIFGAANPELPDLRALLQHNADLRIVGRMADERSALAAAGRDGTYAQYLEGKGDFLAVSAAGVVPFQAAYIDDYDLHLTLTELHRASDPVLLAQHADEGRATTSSRSSLENQSFTYDGVSQRASFETSDRSDMATVDGDRADETAGADPDDDLSWLDEAGGPAVMLVDRVRPTGQDDHGGPAAYELPEDSVLDDAASSSVQDEALPVVRAVGPRIAGQSGSSEASSDHADGEEVVAAGAESTEEGAISDVSALQPAHELPDDDESGGGSYEMLPFDQPSTLGEEADDGSVVGDLDQAGAGGSPAEGAQVLWPVEPTYTDIDDDMWDAGEVDEDDWRKRLH
ncbi:MAG: hypothetical protein JSW55_02325 [Chloroflexota bacterium]|nr:MAG: hypothetical protein JSW55_02325 [Chloroflexota bacterium]